MDTLGDSYILIPQDFGMIRFRYDPLKRLFSATCQKKEIPDNA